MKAIFITWEYVSAHIVLQIMYLMYLAAPPSCDMKNAELEIMYNFLMLLTNVEKDVDIFVPKLWNTLASRCDPSQNCLKTLLKTKIVTLFFSFCMFNSFSVKHLGCY